MTNIDANKLKEHIDDMREKAKNMELEANELLTIAKAIRTESFALENKFEDDLWPKDK